MSRRIRISDGRVRWETTAAGDERIYAMNTTITRWDPFREMEDLQSRFLNYFGRTPTRLGDEPEENMTVTKWAPPVDIVEDDKEYLIKAELPEIKKEDVKVAVQNGVLTITGERKFEKEQNHKKFHRVERGYGTFVRGFALPDTADTDRVNAEYKNGILTVHLPKSERARPKQVEVKIS